MTPQNETTYETFHELTLGKTTYRITSVFTGETELKTVLENIIVKRILRESNREIDKNGIK
ncbi:MAG: hypothetical protein FWH07_07435 [Oscillospiraceae bacterium]|nr:hypothetical protein [Oscillospiraceae bacterium]